MPAAKGSAHTPLGPKNNLIRQVNRKTRLIVCDMSIHSYPENIKKNCFKEIFAAFTFYQIIGPTFL